MWVALVLEQVQVALQVQEAVLGLLVEWELVLEVLELVRVEGLARGLELEEA